MGREERLNVPSLAVERLWTISLMDEIVPFLDGRAGSATCHARGRILEYVVLEHASRIQYLHFEVTSDEEFATHDGGNFW